MTETERTYGQMLIVSKSKDRIVNMDQVMSLFISSDGCAVKAAFENGSASVMGEYPYYLTEKVIEMIADAAKQGEEVFYMPQDESVANDDYSRLKGHTERHAENGAVIKRRGGS